jgi:hypothetical protein
MTHSLSIDCGISPAGVVREELAGALTGTYSVSPSAR